MIRTKAERKTDIFEHKFGADGFITVTNLINNDQELNNKGRCFAHTKVEPGSGIGFHEHHGESELYYVLKGSAEYSDNGEWKPIHEGDVTICYDGESHGIRNNGNETLEIIALILYN